jgi:hypothetical protein
VLRESYVKGYGLESAIKTLEDKYGVSRSKVLRAWKKIREGRAWSYLVNARDEWRQHLQVSKRVPDSEMSK